MSTCQAQAHGTHRRSQGPPGALQIDSKCRVEAASTHLAPHCCRLGGLGNLSPGGRRPRDTQRVGTHRPAYDPKLVPGTRLIMIPAPSTKVLVFMVGCHPTHYRTPSLTTYPCPSLPDELSRHMAPFTRQIFPQHLLNGPRQGCRGRRTGRPPPFLSRFHILVGDIDAVLGSYYAISLHCRCQIVM